MPARDVVKLVLPGGVVCDLFAGSATLLVAAKEADCTGSAVETNKLYYGVASSWLEAIDRASRKTA
jgi:DNA modification methylase